MPEKLTLRARMILGATAAVIFPFLVAAAIVYFLLSEALIKNSEEEAIHIAGDISGFIDVLLRQEVKLADALAADADIVQAGKTGDYHAAEGELRAILDRIGDEIFTIFLTDRHGLDRADPRYPQQIGLDLSDREYFLKARAGVASVTEPFMARGTATQKKPIIIVCAPIREGDDFLGVVSIVYYTDFLTKQISSKKFTHTGHAFLINEKGLVLLHPRKEHILKFRFFDQPGTEALAKLVKERKTGTAYYSSGGSKSIAGVAPVDLTGWTVVFTQSQEEIMAPVNRILFFVILAGIIFLFFTISIIIIYANRISRPIQKTIEMIEQVTQHSMEIHIQIGLDRKIFHVNPALEKITGIRPEAVLGTEPNLANASTLPDEIWAQLESGIPWSGRIALEGPSSNPVPLDVMLVPMRDVHGEILGYLEIGRDVSKEVMIEKRLIQSQKLEAIGTMAGGIAHDFNNILGVIFGFAELLLMDSKKGSQAEKNIRSIIQASERARDLVGQILTFSRQTDVELRPLVPKYVLKEVSKLLRASIPTSIEFELDLKSEAIIMAEPTQLHQILMNLFTNAAQAIGEKPGVIHVKLEDFHVDENFIQMHPGIQPGNHILLQVSDTGGGMEPGVLDQIFEPFFTTKPQGEGTGLGLSVVHGIVKKFNGIITAYSIIGEGTTFDILIPSCTDAVESRSQSIDSEIQGGTERLILIDDEASLLAIMETVLVNLGYQVAVFTNSLEALAALTANPGDFDLVITDYFMPNATGLEVAKRIKQAGIDIPVILISGYLSKEVEKAAREMGISALISKPVNTYHLAQTLRDSLYPQ